MMNWKKFFEPLTGVEAKRLLKRERHIRAEVEKQANHYREALDDLQTQYSELRMKVKNGRG